MPRPSDNPLLDVPLSAFINVWQTSDSVAEVGERLGLDNLPNKLFSSRASWLRGKGVPLKRMAPQHKKQYPDDMMNQLAEYSQWISKVREEGREDEFDNLSLDTFLSLNGQGNRKEPVRQESVYDTF